jgi:hypothetical protein
LKFHSPFTVTAAKAPATLPTPQATVRSIEFDFRGPTTLHENQEGEPHTRLGMEITK